MPKVKENEEKMGILRDKSKRIWYVKMRNDGRHFGKTGWEKFCDDHNLQVGDLLLFFLDKNLVFDVIIMGCNGCESHHFQSTPTTSSNDPGTTLSVLCSFYHDRTCIQSQYFDFKIHILYTLYFF